MTTRQAQIPGTEAKSIPEVNAAAEEYVNQRDKRISLSEKESTAKQALIKVMRKHKLDVYKDANVSPPLIVTLVEGEDNVRVSEDKKAKGETEDEAA